MTGKEYNEQFSEEELKNEIWRDVPNYEGYYQVSSLGRVRGLDREINKWNGKKIHKGKLLTPAVHSDKRFKICLYKFNVGEPIFVHRLVLITFVSFPPERTEGCHNDGDFTNNKVENLRWDTHYNNELDKIKHGTRLKGSGITTHKLTEEDVSEIKRLYVTGKYLQKDLAEMFDVTPTTIHGILHGRLWEWHNEVEIDVEEIIVTKLRKATEETIRKFSVEQVKQLRLLYETGKYNFKELGNMFGMTQSHARNIALGKRRMVD